MTAGLAFAGFAAVISAIESLAIRGQLDFAEHVLGLHGWHAYGVPVALEGGTLVCAALALWAALERDRVITHHFWTAVFLGAAAYANYIGALAADRPAEAAVYLAGACGAALRIWHAILRRIRRTALPPRESSGASFSLSRWLLAPRETFRAWRFSVLEGISKRQDALAAVRGKAIPSTVATEDGAAVDLSKVSKAEATRTAFATLGSYEVGPALEWLTQRGVSVDRSYVYELARKQASRRRAELAASPNGRRELVAGEGGGQR